NPPCTRRDDRELVPPAKSPLSTSAVRNPRSAASRAMPAPVTPPPTMRRSIGSRLMFSSAAARVRNENGGSANSPPLHGGGRFRAYPRLFEEASGTEENVMRLSNGRRVAVVARSEERRVGKECRSRWGACH